MKQWLLLLLATTGLYSQNVICSLSGTIQDAQSAAVASARIVLTDARTGFVRTSATNSEGFFSLPDLSPGTFNLSITAPGFKAYNQSGVGLSAGERRQLGSIRLELGVVSESVTVAAEALPVQLGSGEKAGVITGQQMGSLALRGRDFVDAVTLLPGVVADYTKNSHDAPSPTSETHIFIAGQRFNRTGFYIDGVNNVDGGANENLHVMPSMDAVDEVKVLVSNYAAEYGRNAGGAIMVVTKGGSREFHGQAGWYYRHESLNANNFFNNARSQARDISRYNIANLSIGGPVPAPEKFNAVRNKLFFFVSEEWQRQKVLYGSKTVTVPTALERAGDFSKTVDVNAKRIPVKDPNTGLEFPDNIIPSNRLSATGQSILNMFPKPNYVDPDPSKVNQWNYISQYSGPYHRRADTVRLDYSPRPNWQTYLRLINNADEQRMPYGNWTTGSVNYDLTPTVFRQPGRAAALSATTTFGPTTFNQITFGFSQNKLYYYPEDYNKVSKTALGIDTQQWYPGNNTAGLIPNMSFGGVANPANPSLSNGVPYDNYDAVYSLNENFSKVAGAHSLKFGFYMEGHRKDQSATAQVRGTFSFAKDVNNPLDANYAYANALLGNYTSYSEANARPRGQYRYSVFEWFAQDSWRMKPGFTLEYGVRFYHDPPAYDERSQLSVFVPQLYDPAKAAVLLRPGYNPAGKKAAIDPLTGAAYPQAYIGTYVPGVGNYANGMGRNGVEIPKGLWSQPALAIAPRLGFAWDPTGSGRWAVRGGGGIFYDRIRMSPTFAAIANPPGVFTPTVYYGRIADLGASAGSSVRGPGDVTSLTGHNQMPVLYNYSLGVQRRLFEGVLADVSYVGSLSRHVLWGNNLNAVPAGAQFVSLNPQFADPTNPGVALPPNFLRPISMYGNITTYEWAGTANYNSLQASLRKTISHGFMFGASYTFSKALGQFDQDSSQISVFFPPRVRTYGPLPFDRSQVFTAHYSWRLPRLGERLQSPLLGAVTDGWEIAGVTRLQTGAPFTPGFSTVDGANFTGSPTEGARLLVTNPAAEPAQRFGRPAIGPLTTPVFGNLGYNALRGPGINNWDISLYRRIPFGNDGVRDLQLRLESYNTFNHTQFTGLQANARFNKDGDQIDATFLTPNAAAAPRRLQLAVRIEF